ncbi:MAG: hypothetical protein U0793_00825 [Gemmataceae bacterium]
MLLGRPRRLRRTPLGKPHQNCRTLCPWNQQFADDQIKAVIERDGILGMAFDAIAQWSPALAAPEEQAGRLPA